jgi:hypothetical protein
MGSYLRKSGGMPDREARWKPKKRYFEVRSLFLERLPGNPN